MEKTSEKSSTNNSASAKKNNRIRPMESKTDVSSSPNDYRRSRRHHHHHRSRHHHHPRHRSHHRHRHSYSPCSECTYYSHDVHHDYSHNHPHHSHSTPFPRIITPRVPKIITPTPAKINKTMYRETGVNTGNETKIMRDSSVTADLEDLPSKSELFLGFGFPIGFSFRFVRESSRSNSGCSSNDYRRTISCSANFTDSCETTG